MYTVMVTGGLGSGKSTLCELLCKRGALSIDLDEINSTLLQNNENYINELVERFGSDILDEDGMVVRGELARRAFLDHESEQDLNRIAFPYITELAQEYILNVHCVPRSSSKVLVIEVPLLTEVPEFAKLADERISVVAPSEIRLQRAVERGMDPQDAINRMLVQASDVERNEIADTICDNSGSLERLQQWVDTWWDERARATDDFEEGSRG